MKLEESSFQNVQYAVSSHVSLRRVRLLFGTSKHLVLRSSIYTQ